MMKELLATAGVGTEGANPWDMRVHDSRAYHRMLTEGVMGLGESYMDGWWDCDRLDECIDRLSRADLQAEVKRSWRLAIHVLTAKLLNLQSVGRAFQVGEEHYDIGNDLFEAMLDNRMLYSCGYWKDAHTLEEAQVAKLDLICRKIGLEAGMSVLDIGCGWGGFAHYAAERYGAAVTGVTVSKEQRALATERCKGLPVTIELADYRDVSGQYDAVISIGMIEHVGYKNYRTYMETVDRCLVDDGVALIHTIGGNHCATHIDPWIDKYVFPNALLPSIAQLGRAMNHLFIMDDWHNFGAHYDRTFMEWHRNFEDAWPELKRHYDDRFYRMWRFYLLSCAGAFRSRRQQLWQIVMTRKSRAQACARLS